MLCTCSSGVAASEARAGLPHTGACMCQGIKPKLGLGPATQLLLTHFSRRHI